MDPLPFSPGLPPRPVPASPSAAVVGAVARTVAALAAVASLLGAVPATAGEPPLLPPERAFRLSARALDDRTIEARYTIAEGYYLYRDKLRFALEGEPPAVAAPELPPGKMKKDDFFGDVETYRGTLVIRLPLQVAAPGRSLVLSVAAQGCADAGVCYPPTAQKITLSIPQAGKGPGPLVDAAPTRKNWFN
jgi:thiol:disulfide interchange protein DsbD